jgi:uncharacterized membrane protein
MPVEHHIRNPLEMGVQNTADLFRAIFRPHPHHEHLVDAEAHVARLTPHDLWVSLREGLSDLGVYRSDILFIGLIYPLAGLMIAQVAYGGDFIPLIFPLTSGFALLGPIAAIGLYEISRQRELGHEVTWRDAFDVIHNPGLPAYVRLSFWLVALFLAWQGAAWQIYMATLGPDAPLSMETFLDQVLYTPAGWTMVALGCAVGFVFAAIVLVISAFSLPMLLDHDVSVRFAVRTSLDVARKNPGVTALWGFTVAGLLILGSLPLLAGLIIVVPMLGHATWRLYRRAVTFD